MAIQLLYISGAELEHAISQMIDDVHNLFLKLHTEADYLFCCHMSAQKAHEKLLLFSLLACVNDSMKMK